MIWVLFEIVVPLLIAFVLGIGVGWLLWRWRRRVIADHEWRQHTRDADEARIELATVQAAHEESANERAVLSSRIGELSSELERSRMELGEAQSLAERLRAELEAIRAAGPDRDQ